MRGIQPLINQFEDAVRDVAFVDNEKIFMDAVLKHGTKTYFRDMFGGNFGHCTPLGNRLLAENIAKSILNEVCTCDLPLTI